MGKALKFKKGKFYNCFFSDFNLDTNTHLGIEGSKELDMRMELLCSISKSFKIWNVTNIIQAVSVAQNDVTLIEKSGCLIVKLGLKRQLKANETCIPESTISILTEDLSFMTKKIFFYFIQTPL